MRHTKNSLEFLMAHDINHAFCNVFHLLENSLRISGFGLHSVAEPGTLEEKQISLNNGSELIMARSIR